MKTYQIRHQFRTLTVVEGELMPFVHISKDVSDNIVVIEKVEMCTEEYADEKHSRLECYDDGVCHYFLALTQEVVDNLVQDNARHQHKLSEFIAEQEFNSFLSTNGLVAVLDTNTGCPELVHKDHVAGRHIMKTHYFSADARNRIIDEFVAEVF